MEDEFRDRTDVGITIQAYLRDSEQDVRDLIAWVKQRGYPLTVRLVKGRTGIRKRSKQCRKIGPASFQRQSCH